jgi:predicted dinucleotide-binding enzyme
MNKKIGILGTGDVGKALGNAFLKTGHSVRMGSRSATNEKALAWARQGGPEASTGTFAETAFWADGIVLATLGSATEGVLMQVGSVGFENKVVLDTTNPLKFDTGKPELYLGHDDSLGERVQALLPRARVVKAFNTVGNAHMYKPDFPGGPPDMFIAGNDEEAKKETGIMLREFGWGVVDLGGIEASRYLEPMCMAWVLYGTKTGGWNHAFKMLHKD